MLSKIDNYVLITGGAKRIGSIIAMYLAKKRYNIVIHYNKSKNEAEELKYILKKEFNVKCIIIKANLNDIQQIKEIFKYLQSINININILINNASSFFYDDFDSFNDKVWEENFNINLKSIFLLSKEMMEYLSESQKGNIINIIDQQITNVTTKFLSYNLAKTSLYKLTEILSKELAPNVRVNGVSPGLTMKPYNMDQNKFDQMVLTKTLLKKEVNPQAIASTIYFLLNNEFITGELIRVDSGGHIL